MTFSVTKTTFHRLLWVLAVFVACGATMPSVYAVESGGIGGRPAYPKAGSPRTESIFIFTLEPGHSGDDGVRVNNNTSQTKTIDVYAVDSQTSSGGAFACAQRVDKRHAVGSWITLQKTQLTVGPQAGEIVPFSLVVPKGIASGEYNGCIVIQEADQLPIAAGNGIALSFRSAIRVAVTVPGALKKGLLFTKLDSRSGQNGKRVVSVSAKNQGNVSLDTDMQITLRSALWTKVRTLGGTFPVLANSQSDLNFDTTDPFWGGIYFVHARAAYNPDAQAGIGSGNKSAAITKTRMIMTKPQTLAIVIEFLAVACLIAAAATLIRRKRLKRHAHRSWQAYTVKHGEHIKELAERHGLAWQALVRVNRIKPPYVLREGDIIKLPSSKQRKSRK